MIDFIYLKNLTQKEAQAEAKQRHARILLNREIDSLLKQGILDHDFPTLWTGTHLDYEGTSCKITENGKTVESKMPEKDGWFKQDKFGLPFGKASNSDEEIARFLWRTDKYSGLVARWCYWWGGYDRRIVGCGYVPGFRLGVLMVKLGSEEPNSRAPRKKESE